MKISPGFIVGSSFHPATILAWQDFKIAYPQGDVLSRETGYDDVDQSPFLYAGPPTPGQLPPVARVLTLALNGEAVAYPYETLKVLGVINDTVADTPVVIHWQDGTASPLDSATTGGGRDVGTAAAFSRELDGQILTFTRFDGEIRDSQTDSEWNILGQAIAGLLKGRQLRELISINHFWFSWAAFRPETRIYQP